MKNFYLRCFSAGLALAFLIGAYILWDIKGVQFCVALVCLIAAWEYLHLIVGKKQGKNVITWLCFILLCQICLQRAELPYLYILIPFLSIILILGELLRSSQKSYQHFIFAAAFGVIYLGYIPSLLIELLKFDIRLPMTLCIVIFIGDTIAYIFGYLWGKKKILPHLSPQKTWLGSISGLCGSGLAGYMCYLLWYAHLSSLFFVFICSIAAFAGQIGDFFESCLKRNAQVKNSGYFMPGHGGALDRIDSLLFATPIFFWFLYFV